MRPIKDMTTKQILGQYNLLTNGNVKRFSSRAVAERRLQKAREEAGCVPVPAQRLRHKVTVNGAEYSSTKKAFEALELPLRKHIPFRKQLKLDGERDFVWEGQTYKFKLVPR